MKVVRGWNSIRAKVKILIKPGYQTLYSRNVKSVGSKFYMKWNDNGQFHVLFLFIQAFFLADYSFSFQKYMLRYVLLWGELGRHNAKIFGILVTCWDCDEFLSRQCHKLPWPATHRFASHQHPSMHIAVKTKSCVPTRSATHSN